MASPADQMDRAAERIVEDAPVVVEGQPTSSKTVQGPVGLVPVRAEEPETASAVGDLSGLWNLTAAAPRRVPGPSLQELDDAADEMAAVVATQLGRVAGFAARNLGGVTVTASGLSTFQTGIPGPGTPRQAAVSPDDLGVIQDAWTVVTDDVLGPRIAADYLAGAKGQHDRLAAALPPKVRGLAGRPLLDAPALLHAAGAANRLKGIGDELWQAARTALLEGMARGESVAKLARRVRNATGVSIGRATTIARTESMAARSAGSYEEMLASGVVVSKTWQATGDLRTRPTHVVADGQTVPIASKFMVGGWPADRPHDSLLPPEESINCRCTLTYGVDTDVATAVNASGADDDSETVSGLWAFHLAGKHDQSTHGHGAGALAGDKALAAPPKNLAEMGGDPRAAALWYRAGDNSLETKSGLPGSFEMNEQLRSGRLDPEMKQRVADIDSVMAESKLSDSILVYRGVERLGGTRPDEAIGQGRSLVGREFTDKGFVSTSTDAEHASWFGGTVMRITAPKGTSAIRMADRAGTARDDRESEILLHRGLTYRVKHQYGRGELKGAWGGAYVLDIEVVQ